MVEETHDTEWKTPAKFLLGLKLRSNTGFFVALFILFVIMLWSFRNHRKRKLEIAAEEKQDQLMFAAITFFFLLVLVPFVESFGTRAYSSLGKLPTDHDETESSLEGAAGSLRYALFGMSLSEIDCLISAIICLIVLLVSIMCWPRACDTCEEKLNNSGGGGYAGGQNFVVGVGDIPPASAAELPPLEKDEEEEEGRGPTIELHKSRFRPTARKSVGREKGVSPNTPSDELQVAGQH